MIPRIIQHGSILYSSSASCQPDQLPEGFIYSEGYKIKLSGLSPSTCLVISLWMAACNSPTATQELSAVTELPATQKLRTVTELPATQETDLIQPGDTVNGVLVTTGSAEDEFLFDRVCKEKGEVYVCNLTTGDPVHITTSIYGKTAAELETKWETFTYTLSIENQTVDLPAFGTIDFVHERTGLFMRAYDVVLVSSDPITLTEKDSGGVAGEDSFSDTTLLVFESPTTEDLIQPLSSAAELPGQHPYTSEKTGFQLLLYLPGDYGKETGQTWPLILYLHGSPNITTLDWVRIKALPLQLENQQEFPFIVASPLHTGEYQHWSEPEVQEKLINLLDELQSLLAINPEQVYLTGFLEGGNGAWELALAHPEKFAALAPVGGYTGYPFSVPEDICNLKDMPIWAFHGADDPDLPVSAQQMLVDALKECGNEVLFTIYPGAIIDMYDKAFTDPELYEWMKEQTRKQ